MAGGGMGAMPTGTAQQGGAPMGNPMGSGPGMAGGLGMGGMGFGGGQPGQGGFAGAPMSNPGMPQGDTFQPQMGGQPINMQQISQMLRGLQPMNQQPMQTGSAERNWVSNSPYMQQQSQPQTPMVPQQPMQQIAQQPAPQQGIAGLGRPRSTAMQGYLDRMRSRRR